MSHETLKTVERTLELLKLFGRQGAELTAAELVERIAMPRSVVVRILATLEQAGFVERAPGNQRRFRVGPAACEVGAQYLKANPLLNTAEDLLTELANATGHTAYLGTLYGAEVLILAHREGRSPVRFIWRAGERLPVATTALGKAVLMHLPRAELDAILGTGELSGLTETSLRTRAELDAQLAAYHGKGWITAAEESFPGVFAVGAAVRDPAGKPVAGISLSLLRNSAEPGQIEVAGEAVLAAAASISRRLGPRLAYSREGFGPRALTPRQAKPQQRSAAEVH